MVKSISDISRQNVCRKYVDEIRIVVGTTEQSWKSKIFLKALSLYHFMLNPYSKDLKQAEIAKLMLIDHFGQ